MNSKGWVRDAVVVAVSVAASSAITYRVSHTNADPGVVRTSRIELVDRTGNVAAILQSETDDGSGPTPGISFIDRDGRSRVELGLRFRSQEPYFLMAGNDKRPRISVAVDQYGNPALNMSDHQSESRLLLGAAPGDIQVSGPLHDWGLYVNPARRDNYAAVWVSGERHSGSERAGVISRSAQEQTTR